MTALPSHLDEVGAVVEALAGLGFQPVLVGGMHWSRSAPDA